MKLRNLYITAFLSSILIFGLALFLSTKILIENKMVREMDGELEKDMRKARTLMDMLIMNTDNTLSDYSSWDDTYNFTKDLNQDYIDTNLDITYFSWLSLTALVFLDDHNSVIYADALDVEGNSDPSLVNDMLPLLTGPFPPIGGESEARGGYFFNRKEELMLAVKRPVLGNSGEGEQSGDFVFVCRIDQERLDSFSRLTGFSFSLSHIPALPFSEEPGKGKLEITLPEPALAIGSVSLEDIRGYSTIRMNIYQDRTPLLEKKQALRQFYIILLVTLGTIAACAFLYFLISIIRRIESLSLQVLNIKAPHNEQKHTVTSGNDEIAMLSHNINDLLDSLDLSRRQLEEGQSFLDRMFNSVPTGIFLVEPESRTIMDINDHALKVLERTRDEVIGQKCVGLTCTGDGTYCHDLAAVEEGTIIQRTLVSKSGKVIPVAKSLSFIERYDRRLLLETFTDITEIENARADLEKAKNSLEEKVRERTKRLSTIIDTVMNGIIMVNEKLEILMFNNEAELLFGYTSEEALGMNLRDLLTEQYSLKVKDALRNYMKGAPPRILGIRQRVTALRKGNIPFEMEVAANENYIDGKRYFIAVMRDITDEQKFQRILQEEKTRFEEILETSPIGVGITVAEIPRYANKAMKSMGLVIGQKKSFPFLDSRDREKITELIEKNNICTNFETRLENNRGTRDVLLSLYPFRYEGEEGTLGWAVDITDQKVFERELAKAKEEAEKATRVKSEFLANMSHEIRTPMNAILGLSHLAMQSGLNEKQKGYLSKVNKAAENLLSIINDILDFSKIEAEKIELEELEFNIENIFSHLADILGFRASESGLELMFDFTSEIPAKVKGDPFRLQQILMNLANNALKFTEEGEIVIGVREENRGEDGTLFHFWVKDTGIGITEEQKSRLFKDFSQADSSTTRKYGGTGLGLIISKKIAEMMGGEIWVDSQADRGSTFHFTVKLKEMPDDSDIYARCSAIGDLNILIVDDNDSSRGIFTEILKQFGFHTETATEEIEFLEKLGNPPQKGWDLVLLDWNLPGKDGITICRELEGRSASDGIPGIILMTAYGTAEARSIGKGISLIRDILAKPVMPSTLLDSIMRAIGREGIKKKTPDLYKKDMDTITRNLREKRILLVEDNEINQEVAQELLSRAGIEVDLADDGRKAVDMALSEDYDAILMDCQLPVMDGYSATREIRVHKDLPIIAMTANVLSGDREKSLQAGMNDHVGKPVDPDELFRVLQRWIPFEKEELPQDFGQLPGQDEAPEPDGDAGPRIPGLDYEAGLSLFMGNGELYHRILSKFAENYSRFEHDFRDARCEGDSDAALRSVHSLKGAAGNIAAGEVMALALELEQSCRNSAGEDEIASGLATLQESLTPLLQGLNSFLGSADEGEGIPAQGLTEETINRMRTLLAENDTEAVSYLEENLSALGKLGSHRDYRKFIKAVEDYDFDRALEILDIIAGI